MCEEHNTALVPILQLRGQDFAELELPKDADLLQVLWCPRDHEDIGCCPAPRVFLRKVADLIATLETYPEPKESDEDSLEDYIPAPCCLHPERVTEYPSPFELSEQVLDSIDTWVDKNIREKKWLDEDESVYQYLLSTAPGTKIGGYVDWVQDPEIPMCGCGLEMQHLLTIASAEFDGGSHYRWCPIEEEHLWKSSYEARAAAQFAAGLMLGDMGSLYLFVCRRCQPWSLKPIFQCS